MVAIKKTSSKITSNLAFNNAHIYLTRPPNPTSSYVSWAKDTYIEMHWSKYQIKETDMRAKTATFTSPHYLDLTTGVYCVWINSPMHEDFAGVIISVDYDKDTGLYDYQCQDFSRFYQSKFELVTNAKITLHRVLQWLITRGGFDIYGKVSKKQLNQYKNELSGLRPAYQYEQMYWSYYTSFINKINKMSPNKQKIYKFNPMTLKNLMVIRDKSFIEAIRDLVYGTGAYIDVYFTKNGVLKIEPYFVEDLYQTGLYLTTPELADAKYKFDTTDIITGVIINGDKLDGGTYKSSEELVKLDLTAFFGRLATSVKGETTTTQNTNNNKDTKKSTNAKNQNNPYNTKKKTVYLTSDNISTKSKDKQFMKDVAKILNKNGWKTTVGGVGPNEHYKCKVKDGVWFTIFGGADGAVFKQAGGNNAYTRGVKSKHSRTVIGMHGGGDIRKGGKYYKYLPRAHDDNYSPSSFKGLSYPLNYLTKNKVPIMYASNAKEMASKFIAGGEVADAL